MWGTFHGKTSFRSVNTGQDMRCPVETYLNNFLNPNLGKSYINAKL